MSAGLKVVNSGVGNSQMLTLRFEDQAYGVHCFHKGRIVTLTGVARLGSTGCYLCFIAVLLISRLE